MSNSLAIPTDKAQLDALQSRLETLGQNYSSNDVGEFSFISRDREGHYFCGIDKILVDDSDQFVVDIVNSEQGFMAWSKNSQDIEPLGSRMRSISQPLVSTSELEEISYHNTEHNIKLSAIWTMTYNLKLVGISDKFLGEKISYTVASQSGTRAITTILSSVSTKLHTDKFLPVIALRSESYAHKLYKTVWAVKMPVLDWLSVTELDNRLNPKPILSTPRKK